MQFCDDRDEEAHVGQPATYMWVPKKCSGRQKNSCTTPAVYRRDDSICSVIIRAEGKLHRRSVHARKSGWGLVEVDVFNGRGRCIGRKGAGWLAAFAIH